MRPPTEPEVSLGAEPPPRVRRLARTLSRGRFNEYRSLLRAALSRDYGIISLEDYLDGNPAAARSRLMILRHDVDQHPTSALAMAAIERELGVRSSWYLRWRTADPRVVERLRAAGGDVGLHYETLTRRVLAEGITAPEELEPLLGPCRAELRAEIAAFAGLFGPVRSVCAHGDTRVPWVRNLRLLEGEDLASYGLIHEANLSLRRLPLQVWLTDRTASEGLWSDGQEPLGLLDAGASPVLCLTHPNNWVGGMDLWRDRVLCSLLPRGAPGARQRVTRTRSDRPALTP